MNRTPVVLKRAGRFTDAVRSVVGSLPRSFTTTPIVPPRPAAWVGVIGADDAASAPATTPAAPEHWVLICPDPDTVQPAPDPHVPVSIQTWWSGNPGLELALRESRERGYDFLTTASLVECRVSATSATSRASVLAAQLNLVRQSFGPARDVVFLHADSGGYTARVALDNDVHATLSCDLSDILPTQATLRAVSRAATLTATIPVFTSAVPAKATVSTNSGTVLFRAVQESSHRAFWRGIAAALDATPATTRDDWWDDADTAVTALRTRGH